MRTKKTHIIILVLALIALFANIALFYIPNILGDFYLAHTIDDRLQVSTKDGDYIEIFWGHDFWKSNENEYDGLIKGNPEIEVFETKNSLTGQIEEVIEIVENPDVRIETKLLKTSSQDFKIRREYEIKNPLLLEDLDISFMQLLIGSGNFSYAKDSERLNLSECYLIINKPNENNIEFSYKNKLLNISQVMNSDIKRDGKYVLNLNFTINCEEE